MLVKNLIIRSNDEHAPKQGPVPLEVPRHVLGPRLEHLEPEREAEEAGPKDAALGGAEETLVRVEVEIALKANYCRQIQPKRYYVKLP